ncbi:MAG: ABC transporter ATP-binding protein [Fuerstiella sp.]
MNATSEAQATAVRLTNLTMRFSPSAQVVLDVPELSIADGEFVSVIGTSGCGKSTLLRLIAGLLQPTQGNIAVRTGNGNSADNKGIGMVFQNANLVPWRTTEKNILLPAELGRRSHKVADSRVTDLLKLVGLSHDDRTKRASELSGGMQMRVSLARALVLQPTLLLMDEPFGAVDDILRMQLEQEVRRIHQLQQLTTILVTHNISEAVFMSDRVLVLGNRPATILADIAIRLPSDRNADTRQLPEYFSRQTEVMQAFHDTANS